MDREERESIDSNSGSVRRFRSPPPIRGPPEVYAYTDSDEEEEEILWKINLNIFSKQRFAGTKV